MSDRVPQSSHLCREHGTTGAGVWNGQHTDNIVCSREWSEDPRERGEWARPARSGEFKLLPCVFSLYLPAGSPHRQGVCLLIRTSPKSTVFPRAAQPKTNLPHPKTPPLLGPLFWYFRLSCAHCEIISPGLPVSHDKSRFFLMEFLFLKKPICIRPAFESRYFRRGNASRITVSSISRI